MRNMFLVSLTLSPIFKASGAIFTNISTISIDSFSIAMCKAVRPVREIQKFILISISLQNSYIVYIGK